MLTSDKAEAVLQVFCAIQCKWRLWYEPQVSIEKWYLEMLAKKEGLQVMGETFSPSQVVSPCLSMSLQAVWLVSEPGSFTHMNLVFSVGSNMHVFYYFSATTPEAEPQEADEKFVTIGWFCPRNQILSLCDMQLLFAPCIHTRLISSGWKSLTFNLHLCLLCVASK